MRKVPRYIERTLMCKDHEVCSFTYDLATKRVVGRALVLDERFLPFGSLDVGNRFSRPLLTSWISARALPASRENVGALLRALRIESTEQLMLTGLGLSLTDQYWMRPTGFTAGWDDISLFARPFSEEVGHALAAPDSSSRAIAIASISKSAIVLSSSPDPALNGNLPKFWRNAEGSPRLFKSGRQDRLLLEPFCEAAATLVCSSMLETDDFVPYRLESTEIPGALASCPAFTNENTEFVPAVDVFRLAPRENHLSYYERYATLLRNRGIETVDTDLSKMLAVDRLIGNVDRHWGNFGILVDTETREWLRCAPLFDMGESFGCESVLSKDIHPRKAHYRMPFRTDVSSQFEAFAKDMSWFDLDRASASIEPALAVLAQNAIAAAIPGYLERVEDSLIEALGILQRHSSDDDLGDPPAPSRHISDPSR